MTNTTTGRLGRGWAFPPVFAISGDYSGPTLVEDQDDIRQSLQILFSTLPGERIMRATYGCDLHAYLFENISEDLLADIRRSIRDSVLRYEPRVELLNTTAQQNAQHPTRLDITLNYRVRGTDDMGQISGDLDIASAKGGRFL
ncbi:GPW/gp25 family protein [Pseudomonas kielensis]|uniref:GPW/gp25 family protein n=1 Tax=Pseudomonas kielensis TaxID=2762577 RepID=UPI00223F2BBF|nr:GPW/gp25 family protein [Pseudomonas kielensis]UZM16231.1 GPW/gp25 family protein [Pseudomonas kielensis]